MTFNYLTTFIVITEQVEVMDSETSENISTHSSLSSVEQSSDHYVLKREYSFTGKLSYMLRTKNMSIKSLLSTNIQGEAIIQSYKISKSLTRKSRNLIVEIVITEIMNETRQ